MPRTWSDDELPLAEEKSTNKKNERRNAAGETGKNVPPPKEPLSAVYKKYFMSARGFFWAALLLAVILAGGSIYRRLAVEWNHRTVAVVIDYRDISALSHQSGEKPEELYSELHQRGVRAITVQELTGKDLANGYLPIAFSSLASVPYDMRASLNAELDRGTIAVDSSAAFLPQMMEFLRVRMPGTTKHVAGKQTLIVLPQAFDELGESGILPDFTALAFAEKVGALSVYRPSPASGVDGARAAASLDWLKRKYGSIACVLPAGQMVAGYPELKPLVGVLKEHRISVAQAEFVRQIGASSLFHQMAPNIIPLHSLVKEELISRRLSRDQVVERMVRAIHERSIKLILMRPYDLYSVGKRQPFLEDLGRIYESLRTRGYSFNWPTPIPMFAPTLPAALALALIFMACFWSYASRYRGARSEIVKRTDAALFAAAVLLLGVGAWKISLLSKLLGGFTAALVATEATIWALDRYTKPFEGLVAGLMIVLGGGLVVASYYGTTLAMLRLAPFSGVKLTLLLPPLLILANDLKQRVHPESLADIMKRPPFWGELVLVGVLLVGAYVLTVRSDNSAFVPGWEIRFRDMLERLLWVRPRTKEFLVGYPCLIIYYSLVRGDVAPHYREVFRIGASLAYASAVNTFCHFHTLLPLTLVRVVNGWWLGIVVGFVVLVAVDYIGGPIWRKGGRELFR